MRITKKAIENAINESFSRHGNHVQFDIMDLGKISDAGRAAVAIGGLEAIDEAVKSAIQTYRKN
jgi:hypothetical protein